MADITRWYILFANYEQGLALHDLLDRNNIRNRIAPAPRAIQGDLTCGISLMLEEEDVDAARACIEEHHAEHHAIVPRAGQIKPHRDKYC